MLVLQHCCCIMHALVFLTVLRIEGVLFRRLVLPPAAVELVPNEDSWSELAKQFLRRESFLGQRGKHSSRRKKKGGQHEGADGDLQHRRSADPGRAESWDTDDLQGASPMSSQEVCLVSLVSGMFGISTWCEGPRSCEHDSGM